MKIPVAVSEQLYKFDQIARGRGGVFERLKKLEESQYFPPHQIKELQLEKLENTFKQAAQHIPYYKKVFNERGLNLNNLSLPGDLKKLPLLTRNILQQEFDNLQANAATIKGAQVNYSSGSTGIRAKFIQDDEFRVWMRAHQLRTYQWCSDWKIGEPFLLLWGSEIYWSYKSFRDKISNFLSNRREINTFRLSKELIDRFVKEIQKFQPALISTYPNAIHLIAHEAEKRAIEFPRLRSIQSTSEPLTPEMRQNVQKVFDCEVFDKYGSRETNIVCHESPLHDGMCIQAENVFVEILDEEGNDCPPGKQGKIVLTTLNNHAMPLIRYETQDMAYFIDGQCKSGINLPRMSAVHGRLQDLIKTPNGTMVDAYFFSYLFMTFSDIAWFQVVQNETDRLIIRVFAPAGIAKSTLMAMEDRLKHHTGFDFKLEFDILNEMPVSATGKFRLCVSNLSDEKTFT